jgi:Tfp pilus assembly protein PilN
MINLLPVETKANYVFARRNTRILKWAAGLLVGILGIALVINGGTIYINQSINDSTNAISDINSQLRYEKLDKVQGQVSAISNNLKLMVTVLSKEVLFSQLLQQIGITLPNGAVLTGINITQVQGGIDLQAAAVNYQTASQIQINLQDPNNKIFSKADLISIQCSGSPGTIGGSFSNAYPCKVQIRAQFVANNPFLFINSKVRTGTL